MKVKEHVKAIASDLYLAPANLLATSSETGAGKEDVLNKIYSVITMPKETLENEDDEV